MKSEEGLGIEFDENVICDVCRSPDSEEANEMVFCDSCNICVHQACYGITAIPAGECSLSAPNPNRRITFDLQSQVRGSVGRAPCVYGPTACCVRTREVP